VRTALETQCAHDPADTSPSSHVCPAASIPRLLRSPHSVLEERRQRDERRLRIEQRAEEMLRDALANEAHASDVRQLSAAVDSLGEDASTRPLTDAAGGAPRGGATDELSIQKMLGAIQSELELDVSYPAFGSADPSHVANAGREEDMSKAAELKREAELLRAYLRYGAHAGAYKSHVERLRVEHSEPAAEAGGADTR
jgi:hypothetical protein